MPTRISPRTIELIRAGGLGQSDILSSPAARFVASHRERGTFEEVGRALDVVGRPTRQLLGALTGSHAVEPSGGDLLRSIGIPVSRESVPGVLAGIAAEIVTDPVTYLGLPGLNKEGKAAKALSEAFLDARFVRNLPHFRPLADLGDVAKLHVATDAAIRRSSGASIRHAADVVRAAGIDTGDIVRNPLLFAPGQRRALLAFRAGNESIPLYRGLSFAGIEIPGTRGVAARALDATVKGLRASPLRHFSRGLQRFGPLDTLDASARGERLRVILDRARRGGFLADELTRQGVNLADEGELNSLFRARELVDTSSHATRLADELDARVGDELGRITGEIDATTPRPATAGFRPRDPYDPWRPLSPDEIAADEALRARHDHITAAARVLLEERGLEGVPLAAVRGRVATLRESARIAEEEISKLNPETAKLLRDVVAINDEAFDLSRKIGAATGDGFSVTEKALKTSSVKQLIEMSSITYAERIMTKEAREFLFASGARDDIVRAIRAITTRSPHDKSRSWRHQLHDDILDAFQAKGFTGTHVFEIDPARGIPKRMASGEIQRISAGYIDAALDTFAQSADAIRAAGMTPVSVESVLRRSPKYTWKGQAIDETFRDALHAGSVNGGRVYVPKEVSDHILRTFSVIESQSSLASWFRGWDKVGRIYRLSLTGPFPAYHWRNFASNFFMGIVAGIPAHHLVAGYADAIKEVLSARFSAGRAFQETGSAASALERGTERLSIFRRFLERTLGDRVTKLSPDEVLRAAAEADLAAARGLTTGFTFHAKNELGLTAAQRVADPTTLDKVKDAARSFSGAGQFVDDVSRIALYRAALRSGKSDLEARRLVERFLFDFSGETLTTVDRELFSRTHLFWSWHRQAFPLILRQYFENPRRMASLSRAVLQPSADRGVQDEITRSSLGIPIGSKGDEKFYLAGFGLPIEELRTLGPLFSRPPVRELLKSQASEAHPVLKLGLELLSGEDFFRRRPIEESDRAPDFFRYLPFVGSRVENVDGRERVRANPEILHILRSLPTARAMETLGKLFDSDGASKADLAQFGIGLRVLSDRGSAGRLRALREQAESILQSRIPSGEAGTFRTTFARDGASEETKSIARLISQIGSRLRDRK